MPPRISSSALRNFIATAQGKSYTMGAVTILLVLIIFLIGVFPALSSIFLQIEQNGLRAEALEKIETKRQTLRNLSVEEKDKRAVSLALNANLPDTFDQVGIFAELNDIAKSTEVILTSVTFVNVEARRDLPTIFGTPLALDGKVLNMSLEGDRGALEEFVTLIEQSRRIFNIVNVSLFKVEETSITGTVTRFKMDMQVETYFWNQSKTL